MGLGRVTLRQYFPVCVRSKQGTSAVQSHPKITVAIIDDHELIRRGLRQLINGAEDMHVCCEAGSVAEAMQYLAESSPPDAVIVDLSLPDGNGIELIKRLHARYPNLRMLVSSMHDEELFAERALRAGALGYITKQETAQRVLHAIRQILRGKTYLSEVMTKRLSEERPHGASDTGAPVDQLSDRELEVYELIGCGHRTVEIAEALHLSVKTIETYRAHIKRKLMLDSSAALTRSAVQWVLEQH